MLKVVLALCVAVVVMACSRGTSGSAGAGAGQTPPPPAASTTGTPAPPVAGTGGTPVPPAAGTGAPAAGTTAATGTLVTFTRTGGIAGFNDTLVVGDDGSLTLTDKNGIVRKGSAPAADIARLKGLLNSAAFKTLRASAAAEGADQMTYTVLVPGVGKVSTMDGVENPAVLDQVLAEMQGLMERVRVAG